METPPRDSPTLEHVDVLTNASVGAQKSQSEFTQELSSPPQSPPRTGSTSSSSIAIEEVIDANEIEDDSVLDIVVDGVAEEDLVTVMLNRFPFADRDGHMSAVNLYLNHVETHSKSVKNLLMFVDLSFSGNIDLISLDQLTVWLVEQYELFSLRKSLWPKFYYEQRGLWETIGKIFQRLLMRQYV